jgi:hypothetical protein
MTGTAVRSIEDLEQRRRELLKDLANANDERDRIHALGADPTSVDERIESLVQEHEELASAVRGARKIDREQVRNGEEAKRLKRLEESQRDLTEIQSLAGEIRAAAQILAGRLSAFRNMERKIRAGLYAGGVNARAIPVLLAEGQVDEVATLLEAIARNRMEDVALLFAQIAARVGKIIQLAKP